MVPEPSPIPREWLCIEAEIATATATTVTLRHRQPAHHNHPRLETLSECRPHPHRGVRNRHPHSIVSGSRPTSRRSNARKSSSGYSVRKSVTKKMTRCGPCPKRLETTKGRLRSLCLLKVRVDRQAAPSMVDVEVGNITRCLSPPSGGRVHRCCRRSPAGP